MARYVVPPVPRARMLAQQERERLMANLRQAIRETLRQAPPGNDLAHLLADSVATWIANHPEAVILCRPD